MWTSPAHILQQLVYISVDNHSRGMEQGRAGGGGGGDGADGLAHLQNHLVHHVLARGSLGCPIVAERAQIAARIQGMRPQPHTEPPPTFWASLERGGGGGHKGWVTV